MAREAAVRPVRAARSHGAGPSDGSDGTDGSDELDRRYGRSVRRTRRTRRTVLSLAVIGAVVLTAFLVWAALANTGASIQATDTAHDIHGSTSVDVSFALVADPGTRVACALEAQDERFAVVGWRVVVLPASEEQRRAVTETVRTIGTPVTGFVSQCWAA